jgi:RimJ/RimL family protein N-acetyltransferase
MIAAAEADPTIFRLMPYPVEMQGFAQSFDWLLNERAEGRWIPHAIRTPDGHVVGQSCYLTIRPRDAGVEIGGTWYVREAQGTAINPAAKLALLDNAFTQGAERVEFKTDALNAQSRAALTKLGATFEGIHRRHMLRPNGTWRDSAYFSIIREEWPDACAKLKERLAAFS